MANPTPQRWCHACSKHQDFDGGWWVLYISAPNGECVLAPTDQQEYREAGEVYACGQTPALVLVERYLHTGTFNPPAPAAEPATQPDQFEALT